MTIWLLALILLGSLAGLGWRQGAIRVAFSLVGIILGALLAAPLGRLIKPVLMAVGLKNPILLWAIGPVLVFVIISIIFKVVAFAVHQKVDVHFKYKAGDLRLALWERLNSRLGICLGLFNGAAYLILICLGIYAFSYWTVQMATSDTDPKTMRILNRLGEDLQSSGFIKVAQAIAPMPASYYDSADIVGVVYNNPLTEARLSRYPAFLGLSERPEFQQLANDQGFTALRAKRAPLMELMDTPSIKGIINNRDLLQNIWATLIPNLQDLNSFLRTGKSPKYDAETILGRWSFDLNLTVGGLRRSKPNISSTEMGKWKKWMGAAFQETKLVAMVDHQAVLKNLPAIKPPTAAPAGANAAGAAPGGAQTLSGQWKSLDGGKYLLALGSEEIPATVEGDRLTMTVGTFEVALGRED